jgi:hypothetical protein
MSWKFSVLVVANVTADSDELLQAMQDRAARGPTSFTLLAPATGGGAAAREAAERRLEAALKRMREAGLDVEGRLGVPDPVAAVHEIWDPAAFDEVIVSTLPSGTSKWLQCDLPHRIERMTAGAQVTHVVAGTHEEPPPGSPPPEHKDYGVVGALGVLWSPPGEPDVPHAAPRQPVER